MLTFGKGSPGSKYARRCLWCYLAPLPADLPAQVGGHLCSHPSSLVLHTLSCFCFPNSHQNLTSVSLSPDYHHPKLNNPECPFPRLKSLDNYTEKPMHCCVPMSRDFPSWVTFWHLKRDLCEMPTEDSVMLRTSDLVVGWACLQC